MASSEHIESGFGDPNFSWNAYERYRPTYPPSLWSRILSYHTASHAAFGSALDVGCGSGAAAATLARHFQAVTLVDPSKHNLESAKARFASDNFQANLSRPCEITYHVLPAEEKAVEQGSQDLVTFFEAIHWTDSRASMIQAAQALRPGGTIALVHYCPRARILNNTRAERIWNDFWRLRVETVYRPDLSDVNSPNMRAISSSNIGLDFVPLDGKLWRADARRIRINCGNKGAAAMQMFEGDGCPMLESQVQTEREIAEDIDREPDWEMLVEPGWFHEYVTKTIQNDKTFLKNFEAIAADLWRELYEAVDNGPKEDGKVRITWPVAVVLATRQ